MEEKVAARHRRNASDLPHADSDNSSSAPASSNSLIGGDQICENLCHLCTNSPPREEAYPGEEWYTDFTDLHRFQSLGGGGCGGWQVSAWGQLA